MANFPENLAVPRKQVGVEKMTITGLIVGVLLLLLSLAGMVVCLTLPSLTNNRINFEEAALGLIPVAFVFPVGLFVTIVSAVFLLKQRRRPIR